MHMFIIINLLVGLMYTIGSHIDVVTNAVLFTTFDSVVPANLAAVVWGSVLLIVFIGHVVNMQLRKGAIGGVTALTGFMAWLYAVGIYATIPTPFPMLALCGPQLFFWTWYYFDTRAYRRDLKLGLIKPVA